MGIEVKILAIGTQVCALPLGDGYEEYRSATAANYLEVPKGLSLLQAAALPANYFTVWTITSSGAGLFPETRC